MTRNEIETIVDEIDTAVCEDEDAVGFVKGDGSWELGKQGCQPNNTYSIGYLCVNQLPLSEIADELEEWLSN